MNGSLGVIPEMLYYNGVSGLKAATLEARAGMKWFRSNIRLGSQLALFALAIQFLLSFGHFHGGGAQVASASLDVKRSAFHETIGFAATRLDGLERAAQANASGPVRLKTPAGDVPAGQPGDDCSVCAVMALANTIVDAAPPPYLLAPHATAFSYSAADAGFVDPNSVVVAFRPRGPPIV
jgi:hypothetical protein